MNLTYFGHSAIHIKLDSGTTILFDPYRNEPPRFNWFKTPFPPLEPNYLIITHPHFDHDNVEAIAGTPTIIRHPITLAAEEFKLHGMRDKHSRGFGAEWGAWNIIFTLEAEGLRICHWGDNRADLSEEQWQQLGDIDVLFVTVDDDGHLLEFVEVNSIIDQLQPKVVIPTHYYIDGLNDPECGLAGISKWLSKQTTVKHLDAASVQLTREILPQQTEIWAFEQIAKNANHLLDD